ncbi:MAG: alpha/beta hydrolase [Nanoarchaeota archaeon]|nr:alpha/beta hydrolase [Nanoarchaeota archaeon]
MEKKRFKISGEISINYTVYRPDKEKTSKKSFVIFIHGWMSSSNYFKDYFQLLKKNKIPFIAIDLRGHGESGTPIGREEYKLNLMALDIKNVMRKEKIGKAILLGHSMGGMIAQEFYKNWPKKVKAIILCNSSYRGPRKEDIRWEHIQTKVKKMLRRTLKKKPIELREEFGFEKPVRPRSMVYAAMEVSKFDNHSLLEKIKVPVLIIAADHDEYFSKNIAFEMKKKIKNSELRIYRTNHDALRKKFNEASIEILSFVNRHLTEK